MTGGEPHATLRSAAGFVAPEIAAEFPGLRLDWITVQARSRPSPPALVAQLRALSDRFRGAGAVTLRTRPIPRAYRTFFRQIGLDPDVERIPSERAAVARLLHGGFRSVDAIADTCLVALLETGVPVWALDAAVVDERGLGVVLDGEDRALAVADGRRVHAALFGDPAPAGMVGPTTTRVALFSVGVGGVPVIHIEEALWQCAQLLGGGGPS
jgi:hypothetical protein